MTQSSSKRPYESRKRSDAAAKTRRRITNAAVHLHGSVGPAHTTISGIAERAGVTRVTVYKHFPTLEDVFRACSAHWLAAHPWPDVGKWEAISDPDERLARALRELYAFLRSNQGMVANLHRDLEALPALNQERIRARPAAMAAVLMQGRRLRGKSRRLMEALLTHAVEFDTWHSLAGQGLSDDDIAELILVAAAGIGATTRR
jgi:AcrR family transcriptional regulator